MDKILFGAAYYEEYMPCDRLAEDIALMRRAGINTVRIAESTWSTLQPTPDTFDFCRALLSHTAPHPAVIGFQVDNETKYYDVAGERVQRRFKASLQARFGTVEALNRTFGLAYWSNAPGSWDDFPDMRGCIHAGLATAFDRFRRELVTEYLAWQAALAEAYRRPDQFITHNFGYEWRKFGADIAQDGWSYGIQPQVDHWAASRAMTVAGVGHLSPHAARADRRGDRVWR